jgi:hypothetical protein
MRIPKSLIRRIERTECQAAGAKPPQWDAARAERPERNAGRRKLYLSEDSVSFTLGIEPAFARRLNQLRCGGPLESAEGYRIATELLRDAADRQARFAAAWTRAHPQTVFTQ